jgi:acetate---CoA ligase (ADP-forming)
VADRAVVLPPVDRETALAAIGRLRLASLLEGFRGSAPADVAALADAVVALGRLAVELGDQLAGLDLNPVVVTPDAAYVVDALVLPR